MSKQGRSKEEVLEAEVIDSSVIDEGMLKKVLIQAGRKIAQPALEAFEIILDPSTPQKVKISMISALTYLIMPLDAMPDFIPVGGFSDDLIALTAVISLWRHHLTPQIRLRAKWKLDRWLPL